MVAAGRQSAPWSRGVEAADPCVCNGSEQEVVEREKQAQKMCPIRKQQV